MSRNIDSQTDATDLTQIVLPIKSFKAGLILCRDISIKPNLDILSSCILAWSCFVEECIAFSTFSLLLGSSISIKSMTIKPPRSLSFTCLPISEAASKFVLSAVSSISDPFVDFAELISIEVRASPESITREPPERNLTSLENADSIFDSIP